MSRMPVDERLNLPLIVGPMLRVSGVDLIREVCAAGAIGSFPTANCRDHVELDRWMSALDEAAMQSQDVGVTPAPYCPNLIMRRDAATLSADVELVLKHRCEMVITSVGSPVMVLPKLRDAGCLVYADVATMRHVEKAIEAGVDGLVLLCAGAGGQTGWANPFAFVRAVRAVFDGTVILAGGMSDGVALYAATVLGADFGYMGTRFIATRESLADARYKELVAQSDLDDIVLTRAITGLPANFIGQSLRNAGLDTSNLPEHLTVQQAREKFGGGGASRDRPRRWADIWSAGHSVSGVADIPGAAEVVERLASEFQDARSAAR